MRQPTRIVLQSGLLSVWLAGGPLLGSAILSEWVLAQSEPLMQICGWDVVWLFLGLAIAMGLALLPTTIVCLAGGYVAGFWSLFFTVPCYMLAIWLGYGIGKATQPAWLQVYLHNKPGFAAALANLQAGTWQTVFWLRLSPVLPFGIGNMVLAWGAFSLPSILAGSLLGMLPRAALATWVGMLAKSIVSALHSDSQPIWVYWVLGGGGVLAGYMLYRRLRN